MVKIEEGLLYSPTHEWVKVEGNFAYIGITDYAQKSLGSIVFVDMPNIGKSLTLEQDFGAVESVKAAADLVSPLSGQVVAFNEELENTPELLNDNCYLNYIIKIEMSDSKELTSLLSAAQYLEIIG